MEIGIYTLARVAADPATGQLISHAQHMHELLEEMRVADEVGLDVFGVGENHRPDYAVSAPAVLLAAGATMTKNLRLTSAVTVLSSDDPVRVFQDFATLDLISGGRAEIMAGRGITTESFPLFGYDVDDYDELFVEKLELLLQLRDGEFINWSGKHRTPLTGQGVYPRPAQERLPVWVAVGSNPESAERTAKLGLPMAVAFLTGTYEARRAVLNVYRETATQAGADPASFQLSVNSHGFVADTSQAVHDGFFPYYANAFNELSRERGFPSIDKRRFKKMLDLDGPVIAGSVDEVIEKMLFQYDAFGHTRYLMHVSIGALPHREVLRAIELLGTKVAPVVRAETANRSTSTTEPASLLSDFSFDPPPAVLH